MKTLDDVLLHFRDMSANTQQQGHYFERLIARVLKVSPLFENEFSNVWLWNDWPGRGNRKDSGIDIVAERAASGDLVGIQCKFYEEGHYLDKGQLNSFFAALGQEPFREGMVFSTTDSWSKEAELLLDNPTKPVNRVRVQDLRDSGIDWSTFIVEAPEESMQATGKKAVRPHQREAIDKVIDGFMTGDRGKLIMACGTGKTLTALRLVEELVPKGGSVLFLVPSISLLQQSLTEWKRESLRDLRCFAVCSDVSVGKKEDDTDEIHPYDLVIPATTQSVRLNLGLSAFPAKDLTIVFFTYQSISRVADAQKATGSPIAEFDLVICDEAHRTTGVAAGGEEASEFMKVHDQGIIRAKNRLYMTATPRIYDEQSQKKAAESDYLIASMDDVETYGPEFYRLGFGQAVAQDLLSDYKVLILTVREDVIQASVDLDSSANKELSLDDAVKIIGCWNGLAKRDDPNDDVEEFGEDPTPMRRAVAFSRSIKDSKRTRDFFPQVTNEFIESIGEPSATRTEVEHVDGKDSVLRRSQMLDWLKQGADEADNTCRILSNARCLSEGVDVPALDAVLFLNPRDSVVDVVQSVGRVMRKSPDKKYGYIILPIAIPADQSPEQALNDSKNYRVVWQVLQALRAHDDRFNAMINKLDLNTKKNETIRIIGVGGGKQERESGNGKTDLTAVQLQLDRAFYQQWRDGIYAKIVQKVGDRRYWETWAKDIASIANTHIDRMHVLLSAPESPQSQAFEVFLGRLRDEINPALSRDEAIEMLAQHLITRPVFESLFASSEFSTSNPVSQAMQGMLDALEEHQLDEERRTLDRFYASVQERATGIEATGRQKVVIELYDTFFRNAFPKMAERLGIVYTPVEVVDYLLHSADYVLREHFGKGLTDEGVHVLDPFTGTGTFITRLLQSGLIRPEDAQRKYDHELHANELVLLAYYIAAVNIELVFQEAFAETEHNGGGSGGYRPFPGIVWTDTFQMAENELVEETRAGEQFRIVQFDESVNSERVMRQMRTRIEVIVGNPPYSVGQESENDNNQNLNYPRLDERIRSTYAAASTGQLKRNLYDSYVRAIRWASDRIQDQGVVAFVTNAGFVSGNAMDGIRACLEDEFSSIWIFDARGNARTQGEQRQKEKGNLFGVGSRAPIALTVFLKVPQHEGPCQIFYHDIGDYLDQDQKLQHLVEAKSIVGVDWTPVCPNAQSDWVNQRSEDFARFIPLESGKSKMGLLSLGANGVITSRDAWVCSFSRERLAEQVKLMISTFNHQVELAATLSEKAALGNDWMVTDPTRISWSRSLRQQVRTGRKLVFSETAITETLYRPFTKQYIYLDRSLLEVAGRTPELFQQCTSQEAIYVTGTSAGKAFSVLATDLVPNYHLLDSGRAMPLRYQGERSPSSRNQMRLVEEVVEPASGCVSNLTPQLFELLRETYGDQSINSDDAFTYIYGILHSKEYKTRFASDLKKQLPRIPLASDFWTFSQAGQRLRNLHLEYEAVDPWPIEETRTRIAIGLTGKELSSSDLYRVEKMRWAGNARKPDRSIIKFNDFITLSGVPLDAYDYVVNGKSAIEWIMERYAVTVDKESGIVNDPNDWSDDPRYIIDLVKRIVRVSVETNRIVASLPPLNERDVTIEAPAVVGFQ